MSTRIYDAYRLKRNYNLAHLMDALRKIKFEYLRLSREHIAKTYDLILDEAKLSPGDHAGVADFIAKKIRGGTCDLFNIEASAVIYQHKGKVYLQVFSLDSPIDNTLFKDILSPMVVDYHYQNSCDAYFCDDKNYDKWSDKKKARLEKEWNEREAVWDEIFGESCKPSEVGLTFQFFSIYDYQRTAYEAYKIYKNQKTIKDTLDSLT